jgi:hypothetical protein
MRNLFIPLLLSLALIGCQEVSTPAAPNNQKICPLDQAWYTFLNPAPQKETLIERIPLNGKEIYAFKFDALKGPYAKLYVFLRDNGTCFEKAVSVGSYALTNSIMLDDDNAEKRLFHIDIYDPQSHSTYAIGIPKPNYKEARKMAIKLLKEP